MSKKHRHQLKSNSAQFVTPNQPIPVAPTEAELTDKIVNLHDQSTRLLNDRSPVLEHHQTPDVIDLANAWQKADEARQLFELFAEKAKQEYEESKRSLKEFAQQRQELGASYATLDEERNAFAEENKRLDEKRVSIKEQNKRLIDWERSLTQRELNAEAGFEAQNREALAKLESEAMTLKQELSEHRKRLSDERRQFEADIAHERMELQLTWDNKWQGQQDTFNKEREAEKQRLEGEREKFRTEVSTERQALDKEKQELDQLRRQLKQARARFEDDKLLFEEDRSNLEKKIARLAEARVDQLQSELKIREELLKNTRVERDELKNRLSKREDDDQQADGRNRGDLLKELTMAQKKIDEYKNRIEALPSRADSERLRMLEREKESWETERARLLRENQELKINVNKMQIGVVELETIRDQKRALEASRDLLSKQLQDIRQDIQIQVGQDRGREIFPECLRMDSDPLYQEIPETNQKATDDLKIFVENLQRWIAWNSQRQSKTLYYDFADIRSFVAGLAMSQLILLQGVSGTGKTSLPLGFAQAVSENSILSANDKNLRAYELIEVQAGWRDRQDLIGYYNSFEGKFYESRFLQALYRAQSPAFQDRVFLIILDEMNLSYPEQYFADLLSALERPNKNDRRISSLITQSVDHAPRYFLDNGRALKIPPNVWFVGTANQDETTKDFAPKTYDRAHIMELPIKHNPFQFAESPTQLVSCSGLMRSFANAKEKRQKEAKESITLINDLREILAKEFGIGWGNRLERQMLDYVPVILEAGGTKSEALDRILAMKVLRRLRDRFDNRLENLTSLREKLTEVGKKVDARSPDLVRSLEIVDTEIKRLKGNA